MHVPVTRPNVVILIAVDLLGRYSNPDIVSRLNRILSGQGRDRPSHRPVPSLKQKQTRLADSDRNEVIARYLEGETANALASIYDVSRSTVFAILRRAGIKTRYRILTDHDAAAATEMYESGQSLASIAKHFEVSDGTVLHAFRRLGIPTRAQGTNQWSPKPVPQLWSD
jgi:DNA invertase Pin-like site-specific DNA recombinase